MQPTKANTLYAGADLHENSVFLSLCDENGGIFTKGIKDIGCCWKECIAQLRNGCTVHHQTNPAGVIYTTPTASTDSFRYALVKCYIIMEN